MSSHPNVMEKARRTFPAWAQRSVADRCRLLKNLRQRIVDEMDDVVDVIHQATGKPQTEAVINEIIPTLELLRYNEKNAPRVLAPEKRPTPFLFRRSRSHVEYHPRGVVVVLGPSNFPFQLSLAPAVSALAAGNTVVIKMSEHAAPLVPILQRLFQESGLPDGVAQVMGGDTSVAEELTRAGADLLFLTGGVETGRRVMARAAETLTPVILELGGKDPMIVCEDAPFERSVNAAVYGAFANAGQICVSVDRIFVEQPLYDRFVSALVERAATLPMGSESNGAFGPLASDAQAERFTSLIQDAVTKGARALTPLNVRGRWAKPVVLVDVTPAMRIWNEEIFGPAVCVRAFGHVDEAVDLANDSPFGLGASVWTRDVAKGQALVSRLVTGNCAVNDVIKPIGNPHLPFGGVKQSGLGVYHGPEGLRAFCRPLSVVINPGASVREPNWFPYTAQGLDRLRTLVRLFYSTENWLRRLVKSRKRHE